MSGHSHSHSHCGQTPMVTADAIHSPSISTPISELAPSALIPTNTSISTSTAASPQTSLYHIDNAALMKACMSFSVETDLNKLSRSLLWFVIQSAGASRATLLLKNGDQWEVHLVLSIEEADGSQTHHHHHHSAQTTSEFVTMKLIAQSMPLSLFHLVVDTNQPVLLSGNKLQSDSYLQLHPAKACLALPIMQQQELTGLLYVQNDHTEDSFTTSHVQMLQVLTQQAAMSIENARLYARLTQQTAELQAKNEQLQQEIIHRRKAEEEMRISKAAAERAAETKSAFLSNMSHEIRTPMNAVLGLSRLLLATQLTAEQASYLDMITNSGKLLLTIINDVLDFSRIESNNLELEIRRFHVLECVENATHLVFDLASKKHLDLTFFVHPNVPPHVLGDSSRLQQILLNLLSNACKFTPSGGQVVVTVTSKMLDSNSSPVQQLAKKVGDAVAQQQTSPAARAATNTNKNDNTRPAVERGAITLMQVGQPYPLPTTDTLPLEQGSSSSSHSNAPAASEVNAGGAESLGLVADVSALRSDSLLVESSSSSLLSVDQSSPSSSAASFTPSVRQYVELLFCVRDNGPGISEETQQRLFKSFSQGDSSTVRRFGGTGLGLAISKRLALAMNGQMWCESTLGHGAAFFFTIQTACASPKASRRLLRQIDATLATSPSPPPVAPSPLSSPLSSPLPPSRFPVNPTVAVSTVVPSSSSLHNLTAYDISRLKDKRVLIVSDLTAHTHTLRQLLTSYQVCVHALGSMKEAKAYAASSVEAERPQGFILDYQEINESPQQRQQILQLVNLFAEQHTATTADSAPPAGTTETTKTEHKLPSPTARYLTSVYSGSSIPVLRYHPLVLMLGERISEKSRDNPALEFVKPTATINDAGDDEESSNSSDSISSAEDAEADKPHPSASISSPSDHDLDQVKNQLVLAKLTSMEQIAAAQYRDAEQPTDTLALTHPVPRPGFSRRSGAQDRERAAARRARADNQEERQTARSSKEGHEQRNEAHGRTSQLRARPISISAGTQRSERYSSSSGSESLSPLPAPFSTAPAYRLLELMKPYRQRVLLSLLAEYLATEQEMSEPEWQARYNTVPERASPEPPAAIVSPVPGAAASDVALTSSTTTSTSSTPNSVTLKLQHQGIASISADYPLSILLAEDNPVNQKMMKMFLSKLGYDVEVAISGEQVLDKMEQKMRQQKGAAAAFDVILMDVNMEGMDGLVCTRRIRATLHGLRPFIIAQTANANTESKQKCIAAGMNAFLPKPVILDELIRQLKVARKALDAYDQKKTSNTTPLVVSPSASVSPTFSTSSLSSSSSWSSYKQ